MDEAIVKELLAAVTPEPTRIDWERVEAWLGTSVPGDYREVCDRFGSLFVGERLWLHAPVRIQDHPSFDKVLAGIRAEVRETCDLRGLDAPVYHPTKGGLLPFGSGRGSEFLFWDTAGGTADDWPVVVFCHAGWIRTGLPLTAFLEAAVTTGVSQDGVSVGPFPATAERAYGGLAASYWTPPDRASRSDPRRKALTSGSGIKALQALVPPPEGCESVAVGDDRPADYRTLMEVYGAGTWRGWLRMWHPDHLASPEGDQLAALAVGLRDDDFLPFADSVDGDVLGWVRQGPVDRWPIAWVPRRDDPTHAMAMTFTFSLLAWLRGFDAPVFPGADPDVDLVDQATFEPDR